jgi:hypothetical protein
MADVKGARSRKKTDENEEREGFDSLLDTFDDLRDSFKSLFPPEFVEHISNAGKENLLAVRSLIDSALGRIDKEIKRTQRRKASS